MIMPDFNPLDNAVLSARSQFLQQRLGAPKRDFEALAAPPAPAMVGEPPAEKPKPQFRQQIRRGVQQTLGNWWKRLTR